jgi:hypothetical protein
MKKIQIVEEEYFNFINFLENEKYEIVGFYGNY